METSFDYVTDKSYVHTRDDGSKYQYGTFFTDESKYIRRVLEWAKEYPEDVRLESVAVNVGDKLRTLRKPSETDLEQYDLSEIDSINVNMPITWFKVSPPRRSTLSDEQRAEASERMKLLRAKQLQEAKGD